jgi:hypothetical protein
VGRWEGEAGEVGNGFSSRSQLPLGSLCACMVVARREFEIPSKQSHEDPDSSQDSIPKWRPRCTMFGLA